MQNDDGAVVTRIVTPYSPPPIGEALPKGVVEDLACSQPEPVVHIREPHVEGLARSQPEPVVHIREPHVEEGVKARIATLKTHTHTYTHISMNK